MNDTEISDVKTGHTKEQAISDLVIPSTITTDSIIGSSLKSSDSYSMDIKFIVGLFIFLIIGFIVFYFGLPLLISLLLDLSAISSLHSA